MKTEKISVVQELISLIGEDATVRLSMVFGGTRLSIGNGSTSRQRLSVVVGEELAEKLIFHYQGVALDVPKLRLLKRERRDEAIAGDAASGMNQRELSMKYDLSERQIRNILPVALSENDSHNETD